MNSNIIAWPKAYTGATKHEYDLEEFDDIDSLKEKIFEDYEVQVELEEDEEIDWDTFDIEYECRDEQYARAFNGRLEEYWDSGFYELDDDEKEKVLAYFDNVGGSFDQSTISDAQDNFMGEHMHDEEFARELAESIGAVDKNASWPHNCIDWEWAAREIMHDYFESNGYYFRN